jgi:hypothetical protein
MAKANMAKADGGLMVAPEDAGTSLAVAPAPTGLEASRFVAIRPSGTMAEALRWNSTGGGLTAADLIRVKTPAGGATTWTFENAMGEEESTKEIVGAFCLYAVQGTLWGSDESAQGRLPVLITHDLKTAVRVSDDLGNLDPAVLEAARIGDRRYDWTRLEYAQWGSGKNGNGKKVKESRLIGVLREGESLPLLVSAGPGSIPKVEQFVRRITSLGVPYFQTMIALRLEKATNKTGQVYGQVIPRLPETLTVAEGTAIRDAYTVPLLTSLADRAVDDRDDG